jgi:hypothetical protein
MFSDHRRTELKKLAKISRKPTNTWKLSNTILNDSRVKEVTGKHFDQNDSESPTCANGMQ